jgi:hypothetical protein
MGNVVVTQIRLVCVGNVVVTRVRSVSLCVVCVTRVRFVSLCCSCCDLQVLHARRTNHGERKRHMLCLVELGTAVALAHKSEDAGSDTSAL